MIVFDLKCSAGHVFEAWFGSSAAYEEQRERGLVGCPLCGDGKVMKAVMAPNVGAKGNQRVVAAATRTEPGTATPALSTEVVKAAMAELARLQASALQHSQWVGTAFAEKARSMHLGDEPPAQIHGQATPEQAQDLLDDGIAVAPLLVPIVPPETCN
ncbi:DUF1178 family protein [Sphingomonas sp. CJ20]